MSCLPCTNHEDEITADNDSQNDTELIKKRSIIKRERDYCVKVNTELLQQCKEHKKILDMRYDDIYKYITIIQTSVIIMSTVSSFIQALGSNIVVSDKSEFVISLVVTTYISIVLSLAKFFKLDDKKESIHNLREKFAELHNKIRYRLDTLKPWSSREFINTHDHDSKYKKWETAKEETYMDYNKIIEDKQGMFMEFEKLIDSKLKNYYLAIINIELSQNKKLKEDRKSKMQFLLDDNHSDDTDMHISTPRQKYFNTSMNEDNNV